MSAYEREPRRQSRSLPAAARLGRGGGRSSRTPIAAAVQSLQRSAGNRVVARLLAAPGALLQRDWQQDTNGAWQWVDAGQVKSFPGRPLIKAPPAKFERPAAPPALTWNTTKQKYEPSATPLEIVTIDLGDEDERAANDARLKKASADLLLWNQWSSMYAKLNPVFPELAVMATNIGDDLDGESGYVALAYFQGVLFGASTYELVRPEDREARLGGGLSDVLADLDKREVLPADLPVLYAAYSVAHPFTQSPPSGRGHGQVGGIGSALRAMREWQASVFRIPTFTWATNPRSYLQNLQLGFDDAGPPVEGVFPAPEQVWRPSSGPATSVSSTVSASVPLDTAERKERTVD